MQPKNKLHCSNSLIAAMEIGGKTYYALINTIYGVRYVVVSVKHYVCCIYACEVVYTLAKRENKEYDII